jgi:hypothetical protein
MWVDNSARHGATDIGMGSFKANFSLTGASTNQVLDNVGMYCLLDLAMWATITYAQTGRTA